VSILGLPTKPVRPTFRLFMPSVQLGAMAELWKDREVSFIQGRGSSGSETSSVNVDFGRIVTTTTTTAYLDYKWKYGPYPTISEIYNFFREKGVPDISVDRLFYHRRASVDGRETWLEFRFGKDTVHPQDYGKLVIDGAIPKQELYEMIKRTKRSLSNSGVSQDVLKRIRYSGLVLHDIHPQRELIFDANAMFELLEPNMWFMQETYKRWTLWDYEFRAKP